MSLPGFHHSMAACCALALLLAGCAGGSPAPIEDRSRGGTARSEQRYVVLPGDTLYSIAFRHGLDYRRLAAANDIALPYTIFPGQILQLREADVPLPAAMASQGAAPQPGAVRTPSDASTNAPASAVPGGTAVVATDTSASTAPEPGSAVSAVSPDAARGQTGGTSVRGWLWPAGGRVTRGFDGSLHKGIDIGGSRGDAVRAAAGGRVVYAGSGIAGYGLMLILRHNDEYLSAYGHNDELLVDEGAVVRAGDPIARRGSSGTDGVKLHFEIRRRGRPVDPRTLLPPR